MTSGLNTKNEIVVLRNDTLYLLKYLCITNEFLEVFRINILIWTFYSWKTIEYVLFVGFFLNSSYWEWMLFTYTQKYTIQWQGIANKINCNLRVEYKPCEWRAHQAIQGESISFVSSEWYTVYDTFRKGRKHIWVFLIWQKLWVAFYSITINYLKILRGAVLLAHDV